MKKSEEICQQLEKHMMLNDEFDEDLYNINASYGDQLKKPAYTFPEDGFDDELYQKCASIEENITEQTGGSQKRAFKSENSNSSVKRARYEDEPSIPSARFSNASGESSTLFNNADKGGDKDQQNKSKEFQKTNATNSLLSQMNSDYSIKLEIFEEEENCVGGVNILQNEEHKENTIEVNNLKEELVVKEKPTTRSIKVSHNCVNCVNNVVDKSKSTCDNCHGMTFEQQIDLKNEFDVFGQSIAAQLKNMPITEALEAQTYIQNYLSNLRLQVLRRGNT